MVRAELLPQRGCRSGYPEDRRAATGRQWAVPVRAILPSVDRLRDRACLVSGATGTAAATARRPAAEGAAVFVVRRAGNPTAPPTDG